MNLEKVRALHDIKPKLIRGQFKDLDFYVLRRFAAVLPQLPSLSLSMMSNKNGWQHLWLDNTMLHTGKAHGYLYSDLSGYCVQQLKSDKKAIPSHVRERLL